MRRILNKGRLGLMFGVAAASLVLASSAMATTTIGTMSQWTGSPDFGGFGVSTNGNGPADTLGQTITVPSTDTALQSFSFKMKQSTSLVFRGEVYAWDAGAGHATGLALWESAPTSTTSSGVFQEITFSTGGVQLTAGQQYVLFATLSKDQNPSNTGVWGDLQTDPYAGGTLVYAHNSTFSSLLSSTWDGAFQYPAYDLAFSATFVSYSISLVSPTDASSYKAGKTVPVAIQLLTDNTPMSDADAAALAAAGDVTVAATGAQSLASHPMKYNKRTDQFTYNWRLARTGTGSATITVTGDGYPGAGSQQVSINIAPAR